MMLDEIFGREQFIGQVTVVSNRGGRDYDKIAVCHEYVIIYGKSSASRLANFPSSGISLTRTMPKGYELRELRNESQVPAEQPSQSSLPHPVNPEARDANGCCGVSA